VATDADTPEPVETPPCSACRATGKVISGLGGTPHEVTCPWCEGTGRFIPGHDAQAAHRAGSGGEPATGDE
jgi:DnaJ-class molecular chaperone